jgi:hypothetical protein
MVRLRGRGDGRGALRVGQPIGDKLLHYGRGSGPSVWTRGWRTMALGGRGGGFAVWEWDSV